MLLFGLGAILVIYPASIHRALCLHPRLHLLRFADAMPRQMCAREGAFPGFPGSFLRTLLVGCRVCCAWLTPLVMSSRRKQVGRLTGGILARSLAPKRTFDRPRCCSSCSQARAELGVRVKAPRRLWITFLPSLGAPVTFHCFLDHSICSGATRAYPGYIRL